MSNNNEASLHMLVGILGTYAAIATMVLVFLLVNPMGDRGVVEQCNAEIEKANEIISQCNVDMKKANDIIIDCRDSYKELAESCVLTDEQLEDSYNILRMFVPVLP